MTAMTTDVTDKQLDLDQVKHFDDDAIKLILEYHLAGWRSYMSNKGHAIMLSPDGVTTATVTRDSLRGRSGRNAAAPLKAWNRRMKQEAEQARKAAGSSFGITDLDDARTPLDKKIESLPPRVVTAIRGNQQILDYVDEHSDKFRDPSDLREALYVGVDTDMPRPYEAWVVVDTQAQVLVAHGPGYTRDEAVKMLREQGKLPPATQEEIMQLAPDQTTCPKCGHRAASTGGLRLHVRSAHVGFTCPECGVRTGDSPRSYSKHREDVHGVMPENRAKKMRRQAKRERSDTCPYCDRTLKTPQARANHLRMVHGRDVQTQILDYVQKVGRPFGPQDLVSDLGQTATGAKSNLARMLERGQVRRIKPGLYEMVEGAASSVGPDGQASPPGTDVTPGRDTGSDAVVTGDPGGTSGASTVTSPVSPVPVGEVLDPREVVTRMRDIVAPQLVAELNEVRKQRDELLAENEILGKQKADLEARMDIMKEAMGL